jgi:hypothetical protein
MESYVERIVVFNEEKSNWEKHAPMYTAWLKPE